LPSGVTPRCPTSADLLSPARAGLFLPRLIDQHRGRVPVSVDHPPRRAGGHDDANSKNDNSRRSSKSVGADLLLRLFRRLLRFHRLLLRLSLLHHCSLLILVKWRYRESIFANRLHAFRSLHGGEESGDSARIDGRGPGGKFYLERANCAVSSSSLRACLPGAKRPRAARFSSYP